MQGGGGRHNSEEGKQGSSREGLREMETDKRWEAPMPSVECKEETKTGAEGSRKKGKGGRDRTMTDRGGALGERGKGRGRTMAAGGRGVFHEAGSMGTPSLTGHHLEGSVFCRGHWGAMAASVLTQVLLPSLRGQ